MTEHPAPAREPAAALLEVRGLSVRYGSHAAAVRGASVSIAAGEQVALVGESGSGKTSLAMAVAGFLGGGAVVEADALRFDGADLDRTVRAGVPRRTPGMTVVFQDAMTSLDPVWTVGSQLVTVIRSARRCGRAEAVGAARDWLVRVGLTDTRRVLRSRPYELSGGMRQRAMLALALAGAPRLLIADEPTSALDASLSRTVMELLRDLTAASGTSLLVVSHDIGLCQEFSDRMLVMYRGEIVDEGRSRSLAETARHPYTHGLLRCVPDLEARHLDRLPTLDALRAADAALAGTSVA
ncbi:ABC transporter ATP-binding protein [Pseudonocardia sp. WMMC193]|uniref:ATP-binding cassette domain-containing protein n=1 Tax=Pseudonocardia sp. WMMC193 TaxID=2911965 RepID=UPI001F2C1E51|nr:ABC transporter ATP-binding protein [Pseudonocardia sp. WMMC193]MCF7548390.1 ABC transporter ATP-binding protein [Pseudonocardia sp. WMMC193]